MMESRASTLSLVGGALALDFANTVSGRETGEPTEHLQRPVHLFDWASHAGGMDAAEWRHVLAPRGADLVTHEPCTMGALSDAEATLGTVLPRI